MRRIYYWIENALLRGIGFHLMFVLTVIACICFVAAAVVTLSGDISSYADALWWAFLRLSDPGYLGDDEGLVLRTAGLILTMLGYIVFLGALVAILTSWMNVRIQQLQQGRSPVVTRDHFVILGWSTQVPGILRDLALSGERVKRRIGNRRPTVVVLLPEMKPAYIQQIDNALGHLKHRINTVFRVGNPLVAADLRRIALHRANTVILVAGDETREERDAADTHTIKTLVSMSRIQNELDADSRYTGVAELTHAWNSDLIQAAARRVQIEVLSSDAFVSRLIAQSVRKPGTSAVFTELFTHGQDPQLYLTPIPPKWQGVPFRAAYHRLVHSLPIGIKPKASHSQHALLNPDPETPLQAGDHLIVLADSLRQAGKTLRHPRDLTPASAPNEVRPAATREHHRLLILHWNSRVAALLHALDTYPGEYFDVTVVSSREPAYIHRTLGRFGSQLQRVSVQLVPGNPEFPHDLARLPWDTFTCVLFTASDKLYGPGNADARTLMSFLRLQPLLANRPVLVEVLDPINAPYFTGPHVHTLVTQNIVGHALAQIALRPDLNVIYTQLTSAGGAEIDFIPSVHCWPRGQTRSFETIATDYYWRKAVAIGMRDQGRLHLNPPRSSLWTADHSTEVVVVRSP